MLVRTNGAVLAQEFLAGDEYVVATVSYAGRHRIAAYWKYHKPTYSSPFVCYDAMELLPYAGKVQERLFAYTQDVLDALGIRIGPAHCELMWVDSEPVLVEVNARLSGANPILSRICGASSALDMTVEAYLNPERFLARPAIVHTLEKSAALCFLMPMRSGRLKGVARLSEIEALPSFYDMSIGVKPGQPAPR